MWFWNSLLGINPRELSVYGQKRTVQVVHDSLFILASDRDPQAILVIPFADIYPIDNDFVYQ